MAKKDSKVSDTVIRRLPIYHRFLTDIIEEGVKRISSSELSSLTGFTASQIRQDLNNFGGFGQQGYGYNSLELRDEIAKILGMGYKYKAVVIGAGRLGSAITRYNGFKESGLEIQALFDNDEKLINQSVGDIQIHHMDDLEEYIKENKIDVAVITLPKEYAVDLIKKLVTYNIKGIWNFAPVDIRLDDDDIVIENVRLNDSLLKLSYYLKEKHEEN
ncbi:MAG: redox-sensing transcriptional repressor Rex [Peptoniphilaceae bacterium]